jgi:hypothetical protein
MGYERGNKKKTSLLSWPRGVVVVWNIQTAAAPISSVGAGRAGVDSVNEKKL